jgi:hypothetical protein
LQKNKHILIIKIYTTKENDMEKFLDDQLRIARIKSIEECLLTFGLPATTPYHPDLLYLDLFPAKPSKNMAGIILMYQQDCTIEQLKLISDQPAGIVSALRKKGFKFKSHPSDPNLFHFENSEKKQCRRIISLDSPRNPITGKTKQLIDKSLAACISAIEIYNKPDFRYREEIFSILMINAWELLLKAKILYNNNNNFRSIVSHDKYGTPKTGRSGNVHTIDINHAIKQLNHLNQINIICKENIEILIEIRDNAIHFINENIQIQKKVMEVGTASLKNYLKYLQEWFNKDISQYNFYLMPLSFFPLSEVSDHATTNNKSLSNLLRYIYNSEIQYPSSAENNYNITLNYDIKLKKANQADYTLLTTDSQASSIKISVEQDKIIKDKYRWTYKALLEKLNSRYKNFKQNKKFYDIKKQLEEEGDKFSIVRFLNVLENKGPKQRFYCPEIVQEFDKHYDKNNS